MLCTAHRTSGLSRNAQAAALVANSGGSAYSTTSSQSTSHPTLESSQQLPLQAGLERHDAIIIMNKHISCACRGAEAAASVAKSGGGACCSTSSQFYAMSYAAMATDATDVVRKQALSAAGMQRLQHWWRTMGAVHAALQARSSM